MRHSHPQLFRAVLLWGFPVLAGALYVGLALLRFGHHLSLLGAHALILALWIGATQGLVLGAGKILRFAPHAAARRIPALMPALSFYFLLVLYLSAALGNFYWGATPTHAIFTRFVIHYFDLAQDFRASPWIPLLGLTIPLLGLLIFYQWQAPLLETWTLEKLENISRDRKRGFFTVLRPIFFWIFCLILLRLTDHHFRALRGLQEDPVRGFFAAQRSFFPMNPERLRWAQWDEKAEQNTKPARPQVQNIILIIVDALRADHLPFYGYSRPLTPFLSGFISSTPHVKIGECLANGSESAVGIMSILTSKEASAISCSNYTLPDFLAVNGFEDTLLLSGDHRWFDFKNSYGQKISFFLDGNLFPPGFSQNDDEALPLLLSRLKPADGKFHFFYLHLMSVHQVGTFHDEYLKYQPIGSTLRPDWEILTAPSAEFDQDATNLYDDRILQADDLLKKLVGLLKQKGYLKDYLLVLTADHGQLLGENGHLGHGHYVHPAILHTPLLFLSDRPLRGFAQTRFATELDIAPTIAELAGLRPPSVWKGQSLLRARVDPWTYHFTPSTRPGDQGAVVFDEGKRLLEYSRPLADDSPSPQNEKLVDLYQDPRGLVNLIPQTNPELLAEFRRRATEHFFVW